GAQQQHLRRGEADRAGAVGVGAGEHDRPGEVVVAGVGRRFGELVGDLGADRVVDPYLGAGPGGDALAEGVAAHLADVGTPVQGVRRGVVGGGGDDGQRSVDADHRVEDQPGGVGGGAGPVGDRAEVRRV